MTIFKLKLFKSIDRFHLHIIHKFYTKPKKLSPIASFEHSFLYMYSNTMAKKYIGFSIVSAFLAKMKFCDLFFLSINNFLFEKTSKIV